MGGIVFGNDEKAARVLVNAVDDARTDGPADARQLPRAVVKQRVDERAVRPNRPNPISKIDFMVCTFLYPTVMRSCGSRAALLLLPESAA